LVVIRLYVYQQQKKQLYPGGSKKIACLWGRGAKKRPAQQYHTAKSYDGQQHLSGGRQKIITPCIEVKNKGLTPVAFPHAIIMQHIALMHIGIAYPQSYGQQAGDEQLTGKIPFFFSRGGESIPEQ
jgi:hypothetical protein